MGTIYGYARVSTKGQELETQLEALRAHGATDIREEKFSGKITDRPELSKLIKELNEGDTLIVTKLDRLARNTGEGIELVKNLFSKDVSIRILNVGLLENTTMGNFFLNTMLAVAEMERNLIIERTQEGKAFAKANNPDFVEGRPKTYKEGQIAHALELKDKGFTYKQIEEKTSITKSTVYRAETKRKKQIIETKEAFKQGFELEFLKQRLVKDLESLDRATTDKERQYLHVITTALKQAIREMELKI